MNLSLSKQLRRLTILAFAVTLATGCISNANDTGDSAMPMGGGSGDDVQPGCNASIMALCGPDEQRSDVPCGEGEDNCRDATVTACGREIIAYCRGGVVCPAIAYGCPDGFDRCDPTTDGDNCTETDVGSGPCAQTLFCEPDGPGAVDAPRCNAPPSCEPDENISQEPCDDDEDDCRTVTKCGSTAYCRPAAMTNCAAEPSCEPGDRPSDTACEEGDETCSEVTMCGKTIYCREDAVCDGLPDCADDEESSDMACDADEMDCRRVEVCGSVLYCRSVNELIKPNGCEQNVSPAEDIQFGEILIRDDILYVPVRYSGGCETHVFDACFREFSEGVPVGTSITIGHDANGDSCERAVADDLEIDLTPLKMVYQQSYGAENGTIRIQVRGSGQSLEYNF